MKKILTIMMSLLLVVVLVGCNKNDNSGLNVGVSSDTSSKVEEVVKQSDNKYEHEDSIAEECKKIGESVLVDWKLETDGEFTIYLSGNYETTKSKTKEVVKYLSNIDKKHKTVLVLVSNYGVQQAPIYIQ